MKSVVKLNRLLLKLVLLCHGVIQKGYCEGKAKFNFLGIIWESKRSWKIHFSGFQRSKIQHFLRLLQTSRFELFGG